MQRRRIFSACIAKRKVIKSALMIEDQPLYDPASDDAREIKRSMLLDIIPNLPNDMDLPRIMAIIDVGVGFPMTSAAKRHGLSYDKVVYICEKHRDAINSLRGIAREVDFALMQMAEHNMVMFGFEQTSSLAPKDMLYLSRWATTLGAMRNVSASMLREHKERQDGPARRARAPHGQAATAEIETMQKVDEWAENDANPPPAG